MIVVNYSKSDVDFSYFRNWILKLLNMFKHLFLETSIAQFCRWEFTEQQEKGGEHLLFHSTTSTRSNTFSHFTCYFAGEMTITVFNLNASVYQIAIWWDLPLCWISIWRIDWWCNVCLFTWWFDSRFFYSNLTQKIGGFDLASAITLVLKANSLSKCDIDWCQN